MVKVIKIIAVILGAAVIGVSVILLVLPRQPKAPGQISSIAEVDYYFQRITSVGFPPGMTVAVMKDGEIVYNKAFGLSDGLNGVAAESGTIFPWWSVTKLYTAVAVLQLAEQGKVDLQSPLDEYISWFRLSCKDGGSADVTIEQLLNHQSGLKDFIPEGLSWIRLADEPPVNQTEFLKKKIVGSYRILAFEPGTKTKYTNTEYVVLSAVIEAAADMPYEQYVREHILDPLALDDSSFIRSRELQARTAAGSMHQFGLFPVLLKIYGPDDFYDRFIIDKVDGRYWLKPVYTDYTASTGLSGPVGELAAFGNFLMTGAGEPTVLSPGTLKNMQARLPLSELPDSCSGDKAFEYGLELWQYDGQRVYGHSGGGPGYGVLLAFIPERKLVIAFNANDTSIKRDEIFRVLASVEW